MSRHRKPFSSCSLPRSTKRPSNYCTKCGRTWYPRGNNVSLKCPNCGNKDVKQGCSVILLIGGLAAIGSLVGCVCFVIGQNLQTPSDSPSPHLAVPNMRDLWKTYGHPPRLIDTHQDFQDLQTPTRFQKFLFHNTLKTNIRRADAEVLGIPCGVLEAGLGVINTWSGGLILGT